MTLLFDETLRPWDFVQTSTHGAEWMAEEFGSEVGVWYDRARGIHREPEAMRDGRVRIEGPPERPVIVYRTEEGEDETWPPATDGALDFLGGRDGREGTMIVARAGSQLLVVWAFDEGVSLACAGDTGQLSHDAPDRWRIVLPKVGRILLLPAAGEGVDPARPGFQIDTVEPLEVPTRCEVERVGIGDGVAEEPTVELPDAPRRPIGRVGLSVTAGAGADPRVDGWATAGLGVIEAAVGWQLPGVPGPGGGLSGRAGLRFEYPSGRTQTALEVRQQDHAATVAAGLWIEQRWRVARYLEIGLTTNVLKGQATIFEQELLFEEEAVVGVRLSELGLLAVGAMDVTDLTTTGWGGLRVEWTARVGAQPDWSAARWRSTP